jgi:hypothetical protein
MCETLTLFVFCCGYQAQLERYCSFKALLQNCKKATIQLRHVCSSVHLSVCPHGAARLPLDEYS